MTCTLCCVTDSPSARRVVRCGVVAARALGTPVRFVHFGGLVPAAQASLSEIVVSEASTADALETHAARGRVPDAICRFAEESRAGLIVMGALERERAVRDLAGSTARRVARRAPCSVLLVSIGGRDVSQWSRFVVNVDLLAAPAAMASAVSSSDSGSDPSFGIVMKVVSRRPPTRRPWRRRRPPSTRRPSIIPTRRRRAARNSRRG